MHVKSIATGNSRIDAPMARWWRPGIVGGYVGRFEIDISVMPDHVRPDLDEPAQ